MLRVLIIDDDELVRLSVRKLLEIKGFDVRVAESGLAGVKIVRSDKIDIMITDIFMTDKDGLEVIREVREGYPNIKIIALSGGGLVDTESVLQSAKDLGADRCLPKPISSDTIRCGKWQTKNMSTNAMTPVSHPGYVIIIAITNRA